MKMSTIHKTVCSYYGVELDYPFTASRKLNVVRLRQLIHYLARELNPKYYTFEKIGDYHPTLKLNHCTVMHSIKQVENRLFAEKDFKAQYENIYELLTNKDIANRLSFDNEKINLVNIVLNSKSYYELNKNIENFKHEVLNEAI